MLKYLRQVTIKRKRINSFLMAMILSVMAIIPIVNYNAIEAEAAVHIRGTYGWTSNGKKHYIWRDIGEGLNDFWFCMSLGERNAHPSAGVPYIYNLNNPYMGNQIYHLQMAHTIKAIPIYGYAMVQEAVWNGFSSNAASTWINQQVVEVLEELNGTGGSISFQLPDNMYGSIEETEGRESTWKKTEDNKFYLEFPLTDVQTNLFREPGVRPILEEVGQNEWNYKIEDNVFRIDYFGRVEVDSNGMMTPRTPKPLRINVPEQVAAQYNMISVVPGNYTVYHLNIVNGQDFARGAFIETISEANIFIAFRNDPPLTPIPIADSDIILHEETFESNYNIELNKYDYETGKPLQSSYFQILEAFDDTQDGIEDGHNGTISLERMSPQESSWEHFHICTQYKFQTDTNGYISHSDTRTYDYQKTYCTGHPEPEMPDGADEDEDAADAYEEAMAEWRLRVENCEKTASFHSIEPNEAYEAMLADRDETYENFINLEYQYTIREIEARDGYTLHNHHSDDVKIPVVTIASSESGKPAKWSQMHEAEVILGSEDVYTSLATGKQSVDEDEDDEDGYIQEATITKIKNETLTVKEISSNKEYQIEITNTDINYFKDNETLKKGDNVYIEYEKDNESYKATYLEVWEERGESLNLFSKALNFVKTLFVPVKVDVNDTIDNNIDDIRDIEIEGSDLENQRIATASNVVENFNEEDENLDKDDSEEMDENQIRITYKINTDNYPVIEIPSIVQSTVDSSDFVRRGFVAENKDADLSIFATVEKTPTAEAPHSSDTILMSWKIYDHRSEGEIHFNKRDLDLSNKESEDYDAYADANGDGTLEGAVYGLFAKNDVIHPDGTTGIVFKAGELVSVATTDRNGDGSFMVITEAPGTTVNEYGNIIRAERSLTNLFDMDGYRDDYDEDNDKGRIYQNNINNNGNAWIGRPLICNESVYEIRELARSEGYELSINGRDLPETNYNSPDLSHLQSSGYASAGKLIYNTQSDGVEVLDTSKVSFVVTSRDTLQGYQISSTGVPEGSKFYVVLHDITETEEQIITGYEWIEKLDENGNAVYQKYYEGEQKRDSDGNPIIKKHSEDGTTVPVTDGIINGMTLTQSGDYIYVDDTGEIINSPAFGTTSYVRYREPMDFSGVNTDIQSQASALLDITKPLGDSVELRTVVGEILCGAYDGSTTGLGYEWADDDSPWITLELTGSSNVDFITQIIDWYIMHPQWNSALLDSVYVENGAYKAILLYDYKHVTTSGYQYSEWSYDPLTETLYYGEKFQVYGRNGYDLGTYRVYVPYASTEVAGVKSLVDPTKYYYFNISHLKAIPVGTEFTLGEDILNHLAYVYNYTYEAYDGTEYVLDENGDKIPEMEKVPIYETITIPIDNYTEVELNTTWDEEIQSYTIDISEEILERYGYEGDYDYTLVDFAIKAPQDTINSIPYGQYLQQNANVNAMVNKTPEEIAAEASTYVKWIQLGNPGELIPIWSAGTENNPVKVQERPIKQQIKIIKEIGLNENGTYGNDTYGTVHEDAFTSDYGNANMMADFRFKVYLKSNLERLYRDEDGNVVWLDRNGNELIPEYQDTSGNGIYNTFVWRRKDNSIIDFPEVTRVNESSNVQKIFTKVEHNIESKTIGDRANNVWATYTNPQTGEIIHAGAKTGYSTSLYRDEGNAVHISDSLYSYRGKNLNVKETDKINVNQNNGYVRILESITKEIDDGSGNINISEEYNYDKFFDAIYVANVDKWDSDLISSKENYPGQNWFDTFDEEYQKEDKNTSFKPFAWIREQIFSSGSSSSSYPIMHDNENIENEINTSEFAYKNAQASDAVRQFALDWYLKDEVAKLVVNNNYGEDVAKAITIEDDGTITIKEYAGSVNYGDEIYDIALFNALEKSYNYLQPFFNYDLDTIYSIVIDSEENDGSDKDNTTLNANQYYKDEDDEDGYYYGVTAYLPYGDYIIVEQQPSDIKLGDFKNKHYQIDSPKEVTLPTIYADDNKIELNTYFNYNPIDTPERFVEKYKIRFNEEWADNHTDDLRCYVIQAHSHDGDFEVYKYGLDVNQTTGTIDYNGGSYVYEGFSITQEMYDPLKDYYNSPLVDTPENGGNEDSHYYADDTNGTTATANGSFYGDNAIEKRYHYASISEHAGISKGVKTMTGIKTAYTAQYGSMLVPWSVTTPVTIDQYSYDDFTGYADVIFRNVFYKTYLKFEKLDSETGENILHDGAIFALYAASRYTNQEEVDRAIANGATASTKIGDVKFYLEDTWITGSYEFLKAMGADNIKEVSSLRIFGKTENHYTGMVPTGTPICEETEQIILYDEMGAKTGEMTVYTTTNDVEMVNEEDGDQAYHDQNTGYFVTPQPLGAGVYVLAELKPPAGYVKSTPIAIEIYSDGVSYYINGDIEAKVNATIYRQEINQ